MRRALNILLTAFLLLFVVPLVVSAARYYASGQAKADWRAGRMKLPDFDNQEFIPLA